MLTKIFGIFILYIFYAYILFTPILFSKVWTLSISPNGKYVVTSGHDKTLRLWEKTQEPLVLDDEREIEREKEEEEQLATGT